jgi:hypothetical protein
MVKYDMVDEFISHLGLKGRIYQPSRPEGFPRQKAAHAAATDIQSCHPCQLDSDSFSQRARHVQVRESTSASLSTTAGCNGILTRTQTEATRTHSLMSPMLVTSDETGLESVGGEIVSGRADGSKGVRGGDALKMIASPTVTGCQASSIATSSTRTQAVSSVCSLTASTLATLGFLLPASHAGSRS